MNEIISKIYAILDDGPAEGTVREIDASLKVLCVRMNDRDHIYARYALWPHDMRIARFCHACADHD